VISFDFSLQAACASVRPLSLDHAVTKCSIPIVKRELEIDRSLSDILQILSLTLFEKTPVFQALSAEKTSNPESTLPKQMTLSDL
jgi:hypothetical protein